MFFGTPFQGSDLAKWGIITEKFLKAFTDTNDINVKALKPGSETLVMINNNFAKFLFARAESPDDHTVDVICFFESLSLKIKGGVKSRIVPQESAVLVGRDPIDIEADHISMCKFEDEERRGYIRASDALCSWVKKINDKLPKQEMDKVCNCLSLISCGSGRLTPATVQCLPRARLIQCPSYQYRWDCDRQRLHTC